LTLQFQTNFGRTYFQSSALLKNLFKIQFAFELLKLLLNFVFTSGDLELVDISIQAASVYFFGGR